MQLPNGRYTIRNSVTAAKDQTYALYNLTQDQLSEMAGYSRNHLQRVETAVCKPTVGLLLDVSEVLGVPVERLMEIRK